MEKEFEEYWSAHSKRMLLNAPGNLRQEYLESIKSGFPFMTKKWEKIPVIKKYQNIMNYLTNGLEMCNLYSNIRLKRNYGLVHNLAD